MKKILIAISLCASTALLANDANYHWEFSPTIGGVLAEGNTDMEDGFTFGFRIAKNLGQEYWLDQIELGYDRIDGMSLESGVNGPKPDVDIYHLNFVKDLWDFNSNLKLYGLIGGGYMDFDERVQGKDYSSGFGQYGLGLKYYISDNFATKLEVRDAITFDDAHHFLFYTFGFGIDFGKRTSNVVEVANVVGDSDGDGVPDNLDRCPGTPAGVVVDEFGCEKVVTFDVDMTFAFDSAKLTTEASHKIDEVADELRNSDHYKVLLEGHTDSTGNADYNQKLSERRANSVKDGLIAVGIEEDRITTVGYGETRPAYTNDTREGRAANRRVEAKFRK